MSKQNKKGSDPPIKMVVKKLGPPVRKRSERLKLEGFSCKECEDYFKNRNLTGDELKKRLNNCSRHRSKHSPPKSPEHFWEMDFPSTPELIRRGAFNIEEPSKKRKKQKTDKDGPLFPGPSDGTDSQTPSDGTDSQTPTNGTESQTSSNGSDSQTSNEK